MSYRVEKLKTHPCGIWRMAVDSLTFPTFQEATNHAKSLYGLTGGWRVVAEPPSHVLESFKRLKRPQAQTPAIPPATPVPTARVPTAPAPTAPAPTSPADLEDQGRKHLGDLARLATWITAQRGYTVDTLPALIAALVNLDHQTETAVWFRRVRRGMAFGSFIGSIRATVGAMEQDGIVDKSATDGAVIALIFNLISSPGFRVYRPDLTSGAVDTALFFLHNRDLALSLVADARRGLVNH
jgi:hypothetical protein